MSDKKHIDRLFQEKLKNFEATPDDAIWEKIDERLHQDKRKRKVIPLWWKVAGVAALLALLFTVGINFMSNDFNSNSTNPIVDTEKQSLDKSNETISSDSNNSIDYQNKKVNNSGFATENGSDSENFTNDISTEASNSKSENNPLNQDKSNIPDTDSNRIVNNTKSDSEGANTKDKLNRSVISNDSSKENAKVNKISNTKGAVVTVSENKSDQNNVNIKKEQSEMDKLIKDSKRDENTRVTNTSEKIENIISEEKKEDAKKDNNIEEAIAEANTEDEKEKEKKLNRWNVSPNVAPVFFNSLGKGSSLDEQFVDNNKSSDVTMSYGVGGSYAVNDRLKVRAGINKVDMGYNTNNVIAFKSIDANSQARSQITNISMNVSAENITYMSTESLNRNITPEIINSKSQGSLNQRFGFIEVPLELEYALINKKLGVNVIGGFSTLFVDKNEIYSVLDGTETRIGEANNINNMSYSANFGFGIYYNISEKIKVNVEPTFKYQINTFNNSSGDFQPYFIGVYTGLSYKF